MCVCVHAHVCICAGMYENDYFGECTSVCVCVCSVWMHMCTHMHVYERERTIWWSQAHLSLWQKQTVRPGAETPYKTYIYKIYPKADRITLPNNTSATLINHTSIKLLHYITVRCKQVSHCFSLHTDNTTSYAKISLSCETSKTHMVPTEHNWGSTGHTPQQLCHSFKLLPHSGAQCQQFARSHTQATARCYWVKLKTQFVNWDKW